MTYYLPTRIKIILILLTENLLNLMNHSIIYISDNKTQ